VYTPHKPYVPEVNTGENMLGNSPMTQHLLQSLLQSILQTPQAQEAMVELRALCIHLHNGELEECDALALKLDLYNIPIAGEFFELIVFGEPDAGTHPDG